MLRLSRCGAHRQGTTVVGVWKSSAWCYGCLDLEIISVVLLGCETHQRGATVVPVWNSLVGLIHHSQYGPHRAGFSKASLTRPSVIVLYSHVFTINMTHEPVNAAISEGLTRAHIIFRVRPKIVGTASCAPATEDGNLAVKQW